VSTGPRYSIGEPGRASAELPAGPPPIRVGPADIELSTFSVAGMLIHAASSRGLEHRARGTVRQDAFALSGRDAPDGTEALVAVVCDGVGSLPLSDVAAAFASRRLAVLGAEAVPWAEAFPRVNAELRKVAEEAETDAATRGQGMATTAVAVTVRRDDGDWVGDVAWVGDSLLWHLDADSRWRLLTCSAADEPDSEYHSGAVTPLPTSEPIPVTCPFRLHGGALFLTSDGIGNPLRWSSDVQAALAGWWAGPPDPFTFAQQVGFARKSHLDDRTVVGIWADEG
jgi:hypothetical protein